MKIKCYAPQTCRIICKILAPKQFGIFAPSIVHVIHAGKVILFDKYDFYDDVS